MRYANFGSFGYFREHYLIIWGISKQFWVFLDTCDYLWVVVSTSGYFWVFLDNLGYFGIVTEAVGKQHFYSSLLFAELWPYWAFWFVLIKLLSFFIILSWYCPLWVVTAALQFKSPVCSALAMLSLSKQGLVRNGSEAGRIIGNIKQDVCWNKKLIPLPSCIKIYINFHFHHE